MADKIERLFNRIAGRDSIASWRDFEKYLRHFEGTNRGRENKTKAQGNTGVPSIQSYLHDSGVNQALASLYINKKNRAVFGDGDGLEELGQAFVRVGGGGRLGLTLTKFRNLVNKY